MLRKILKSFTAAKQEVKKQEAASEEVIKAIPRFKFKVNQRIKLTLSQPDGLKSYSSIIQEVFDESFAVSMPLEKGIYVLFREHEPVEVSVYENSGVYVFSTTVLDKISLPIPLVYLNKPKQVKRFQQREYFRTRALLETQFNVLPNETMRAMPRNNQRGIVWSRDISAGGLCVSMPLMLPVDSMLEIIVEIPPLDGSAVMPIQAEVQVRRVNKDQYSDNYFIGAEFTKITAEDRQKINRFVSLNERLE